MKKITFNVPDGTGVVQLLCIFERAGSNGIGVEAEFFDLRYGQTEFTLPTPFPDRDEEEAARKGGA